MYCHRCAIFIVALFYTGFNPVIAAGFELKSVLPVSIQFGDQFEWRLFLAPFHSVVLHLPIGFVTMAGILDFYYLFYSKSPSDTRKMVSLVLAISTISAVVVAGLGLLRASGGGYDEGMLLKHQRFGILVGLVTALAYFMHQYSYTDRGGWISKFTFRGLLIGDFAVLAIAGHLGGNLTHGSDYLVKNAPEFVKTWLNDDKPDQSVQSAEHGERGMYQEMILPIFEEKCFRCHGPEKQKGSYRLDRADNAMNGGDSELTAIIPGEPLKSNLIQLITLDENHEDIMPPSGKAPLTATEIMNIFQWIRLGASFAELSQENTLEKISDVTTINVKKSEELAPVDLSAIDWTVEFSQRIQPIFENRCLECHGKKKQKGELRLDRFEDALKGGDYDRGIVVGQPEKSGIYMRISINPEDDEDDEIMPPTKKEGPLSDLEIELITRWIKDGAKWPEGLILLPPSD